MAGRRPDPASVREQKAAVRSRRSAPTAADAAAVEVGGLKAPAWLKGEGLEIWRRRGPALQAAKLLQQPDELAFARYCRDFALWLAIRGRLDRRGYAYVAENVNGKKLRRIDPEYMVSDRLERQLLAMEDRFGLNPSERQRIFVARATGAAAGDLFDRKPEGDAAAQPAAAALPVEAPTGFLN